MARAVARFIPDVGGAYRGLPSSPSSYLVIRRAHVWTSGWSTMILARFLRGLPGAADSVERTHVDRLIRRWGAEVDALAVDGACRVPDAFTPEELRALVEFAMHGPATLTHSDGSTTTGSYHERNGDVVSVRLDPSFVLTRPEVQAMLARAMAAEIATARFKMWSTVHPPILYWSCHTDVAADDLIERRLARRYHSDFDGLGGLRLHVYLTDVDPGSAPMDYVHGSHQPGAIPRSLRRDVTDEIAESTVRAMFPDEAFRTFTGPAGTSFMSDSNGLHRGNAPVSADRLFLVMPIQAGSLAGAFNRVRRIPVFNDGLAIALRSRRPDLRLFEAAQAGSSKVAVFAS